MGVVIDASSPAIVTGNPTATTASFTPPDGSILVVAFAGNTFGAPGPSIPTVTDNLGVHLTYTLSDWRSRPDDTTWHPDGQTAIWTAPVATGAAMTVAVTNNDPSNRSCAVKVWVVTGASAPGAHGAANSTPSASSIAQSYTATADGSLGFLAACDWDATGSETAGSGCTLAGSGTIPGEISYGFAQRTTADGVNGASASLNMTLPASSSNLTWCWVELTPLVGDVPEKDPPPFINWHPPGEGLAPNGIWSPWLGTDNAAPTDTGIRIHESSPFIAVNTVNSTTTVTTTSFTPPAGSLLLVLWAGNSATAANPSAPSISDSLGGHLTYSQSDWQSRADAPTVNGQAAIWTAPMPSSAPMTVTVTNNAATGFRESAVQVLVLINEHPSAPVGAHGKAGSSSLAVIAQSYTAQATGGQGFLVYSDWSEQGIAQAGTDCWPAREGSFGTLSTIFSWGMFRRLIPDDVNATSNRINVNLPAASTSLAYAYIEILPTAAIVASATPAPVVRTPPADVRPGRAITARATLQDDPVLTTAAAVVVDIASPVRTGVVLVTRGSLEDAAAAVSTPAPLVVDAPAVSRAGVSLVLRGSLEDPAPVAASTPAPLVVDGPGPFRPGVVVALRSTLADPPVDTTPAPIVLDPPGVVRGGFVAVSRSSLQDVPAGTVPLVVAAPTPVRAGYVALSRSSLADVVSTDATPAPVVVAAPAPVRAGVVEIGRGTLADDPVLTTAPPVVVAAPLTRPTTLPPLLSRTPLDGGGTATPPPLVVTTALRPPGRTPIVTRAHLDDTQAAFGTIPVVVAKAFRPTWRPTILARGSFVDIAAAGTQPLVVAARTRARPGVTWLSAPPGADHDCFVFRPGTGTVPHGGATITRPSTGTLTHGGSVIVRPNTGIVENEC